MATFLANEINATGRDVTGPTVVGTVMNSTLAKQNEDSMTGKQNISRLSLKATIHQPLLIM